MTDGKTIPTEFKPSTFGYIPINWEVIELGELFEFKNGINAGKESYGKGVKFINVMEVINNDWLTADKIPGFISISDHQKKMYLVKDGDVLFNRTSETTDEVGLTSVFYGSDEVVFGGFVIRGRPLNLSITNGFKKYCFRSKLLRYQIIKNGQGVIRSNIGQADLRKIKILLPPLPEQAAISTLIAKWDTAINEMTKLITQKELRKKWLMQQLLTGKKRLAGFNGKIEFHVLGHYIKEVSERNSDNKIINVLSVTNSRGFINQSEQFDRVVASEDNSNYKIVRRGQFAYNPSRINVGSLDLLRHFEEGILSPMYVVFEANPLKLDVEFLYYQLKSFWFHGHIPMFVQGSVRDSLSYDGLCSIKFLIPSIEEQTAIAQVFQSADKEISLLKSKLEKLKEQKRGLMQVLLTGKKRLIKEK